MTETTRAAGFYGTDAETYYTDGTRCWIVASEDDLGTSDPVEIDPADMPAEAAEVDGLMTPDEAIEHCRRIEAAFGVTLTEAE